MPTITNILRIFMVSSALLMVPRPLQASDTPAQDKPVYGGTLVIGSSNPPAEINPVLTQNSVGVVVINLIYDSLILISSDGKIVPDLAKSWEISKDGLE